MANKADGFWLAAPAMILTLGCGTSADSLTEGTSIDYPPSARLDHTDDYHGVPVNDPYRWLEELDRSETADWVASQNDLSRGYLEGLPRRQEIEKRLEELWNYERFNAPFKKGHRYFYSRNDGLQDQSVLFVTDDASEEGRVLLDPNTLSDDGTISLASYEVSPDGSKLAYGTSDGGTDWKTWRVRDIASGEDLEDLIQFTKFTQPSWARDSRGFFYSRYPLGEDGAGDDGAAVRVFFHEIGRAQNADELIYEKPDQPNWQPYAEVSEDGRYLVVTLRDGFSTNAVAWKDLENAASSIEPLFSEWDGLYTLIGGEGESLFFLTNKSAPNSRVVRVEPLMGAVIEDVIPEARERLEDIRQIGGHLVATYLKDASSQVKIFDLAGRLVREVELPGLGTVVGFGGTASDPETFYSFSSYTSPSKILRYDVATGEQSLFREPDVAADFSGFETHQSFYKSKDGTEVPIFITHKKGLDLDGSNPTLLYAYGGFDISLTPEFRVDRFVWLEMGGVLAIANLRGGGEYGEEWHQAGTKLRKQNVFDDFIAAAEYLIAEGYTSTPKLAVHGGSNGGLLIGAVTNQRPELFGAALPAVGVMDMLRYHLPSSNARSWSSDYGLSENEEEFQALLAYSPYHNIQKGTCYPPTLITTADHDDRVVPWHSFKYGAALQEAQACANPVIVRIETRAGHGAGTPTWMVIEQVADRYAFLHRALDM